jgi:hypothetical protein
VADYDEAPHRGLKIPFDLACMPGLAGLRFLHDIRPRSGRMVVGSEWVIAGRLADVCLF